MLFPIRLSREGGVGVFSSLIPGSMLGCNNALPDLLSCQEVSEGTLGRSSLQLLLPSRGSSMGLGYMTPSPPFPHLLGSVQNIAQREWSALPAKGGLPGTLQWASCGLRARLFLCLALRFSFKMNDHRLQSWFWDVTSSRRSVPHS